MSFPLFIQDICKDFLPMQLFHRQNRYRNKKKTELKTKTLSPTLSFGIFLNIWLVAASTNFTQIQKTANDKYFRQNSNHGGMIWTCGGKSTIIFWYFLVRIFCRI